MWRAGGTNVAAVRPTRRDHSRYAVGTRVSRVASGGQASRNGA
jgi:hypothetical protein